MEADALDDVGVFSELMPEERERVAAVMRVEKHPRGKVLTEEGDASSKFYVVLKGHVTVHRDGIHLADLGPGDFFGEMGVLSLNPRNATAIATTPVEVAAAMGWDLRGVLDDLPEVRRRLEDWARREDD